jgi:hypothetical protein
MPIQWCPICQQTRSLVRWTGTQQHELVCNVCGTTVMTITIPPDQTNRHPFDMPFS